MGHGRCRSVAGRPIADKVGADLLNSIKASPQKIADLILEFLKEQHQAESAYLLYLLHKDDIAAWGNVRQILLSRANSHRLFVAVANVLEASTKAHLDYSFVLIPGLLNIIQKSQTR